MERKASHSGRSLVVAAYAALFPSAVVCKGMPILFHIKYEADIGPLEATRKTIVSDDQWRTFWNQLQVDQLHFVTPPQGKEQLPIPAVDFVHYELVVASAGTKPMGGYSISIASISDEGRSILVTIVNTIPGPLCAGIAMQRAPIVIAQIPATHKPVTFKSTTKVANCS